MFINFAWPKREVKPGKPTTFFWVQANTAEAMAVLAQNKFEPYEFDMFLHRTLELSKRFSNAYDFDFPNTDPHETVGFLVASDGKTIEYFDPKFLYERNELGDRVFLEIEPFNINEISYIKTAAREIYRFNPKIADQFNFDEILPSVNLRLLREIGMERYVANIPRTPEEMYKATDDEIAMAIFIFTNSLGVDWEFRGRSPEYKNFDWMLIDEYQARVHTTNPSRSLPNFFPAGTSVISILARRARAEKNHVKLQKAWRTLEMNGRVYEEDYRKAASDYDDDQFAEMFLYNWFFQPRDSTTKNFISECHSRIFGREGHHGFETNYEFNQDYSSAGASTPNSTSNPIAKNPFLGPQWLPLAKVIAFILEDARSRQSCELTTYGKNFGMNPYTSPYMQALWEDDETLHVELSGNSICEPPLNGRQVAELEFIGWNPPDDDIPNFYRAWEKPNLTEVAEFVLTSLTSIYGIEESDHFAFGLERLPDLIEQMNLLERLPKTPGNEWGAIFRLKES